MKIDIIHETTKTRFKDMIVKLIDKGWIMKWETFAFCNDVMGRHDYVIIATKI